MKKRIILVIGIAACCVGVGVLPTHALSVSQATAQQLVETILGSGTGISVVPGSIVYNGGAAGDIAVGKFSGGAASGITIKDGIVLTSGSINNAPGPNNQDGATLAIGRGGDASLNSLVPGYQTHDATVLEFDFITTKGDVFFNYVFASEEYNEYTHSSFNDVFGFFLDGANIALIPGTSTPVSINNVNGGNPYGTAAQHPEFFNNNDLTDGGPYYDIQYDGFTDVFTAQALGLDTLASHHIKLAISDSGDFVLDSAVFIEAGSFADVPKPPGGVPDGGSTLGLLALALLGCAGLSRRIRT